MLLALWLKENYIHNDNMVKYLETGNTGQMTINSIKNGSDGSFIFGDPERSEYVDKRKNALSLFLDGEYGRAEALIRDLIEAKFEPSSSCVHLARILMMTNNISEARKAIAQAEEHKKDAEFYVVLRIIYFQALFAVLDKKDFNEYLSRLKSGFEKEGAQSDWTMRPVLESLKPQIPAHLYKLLIAILDAMTARNKLPRLSNFPLWSNLEPKDIEI